MSDVSKEDLEVAEDLNKLTPSELAEVGGLEKDYDDPKIYPLLPGVSTTRKEFADRFVDYSARGPDDMVLSGPIVGGHGPGRYFRNKALAKRYLILKFGAGRVRELERFTYGRWAFLIKNLRLHQETNVANNEALRT